MTRISRRIFIGGSAALVASLRYSQLFARPKTPDLIDVSGTDRAKMVAAALAALGGIEKFVHKGDYVVIKANGGFANPPEWATTTPPETVVAVVKACLEAKAKQVLLVENPVSAGKKAVKRCGLEKALKELPDVQIKVLSGAADFRSVKIKKGVALEDVEIAKAVLSADVLINIPVAKQHESAGVSFGLKNHMGLIRDRRTFHTSLDLSQAVADLGLVIKPDLTILDATRALLSNGPAGPGDTATPERMVAGRDIVAVDAYGLTLARFDSKKMTPADARHIELAGKAGLGETDVGKLKVKKLKA